MKMNRRILGLDTGLAHTGWCVVDDVDGVLHVKACGVIETKPGQGAIDRGTYVASRLTKVLDVYAPDFVTYEAPSLPPNAGSTWKIGVVFGIVVGMLYRDQLPAYRFTPVAVKKAVIGGWRAAKGARSRSTKDKRAGKDAMQRAISAIFKDVEWPKRKDLHEHIADALGTVVAGLAREKENLARIHRGSSGNRRHSLVPRHGRRGDRAA